MTNRQTQFRIHLENIAYIVGAVLLLVILVGSAFAEATQCDYSTRCMYKRIKNMNPTQRACVSEAYKYGEKDNGNLGKTMIAIVIVETDACDVLFNVDEFGKTGEDFGAFGINIITAVNMEKQKNGTPVSEKASGYVMGKTATDLVMNFDYNANTALAVLKFWMIVHRETAETINVAINSYVAGYNYRGSQAKDYRLRIGTVWRALNLNNGELLTMIKEGK